MPTVHLLNEFVEKNKVFQMVCFIQVGSKLRECPSFVLDLEQIIVESE